MPKATSVVRIVPILLVTGILCPTVGAADPEASLTIRPDQPGARISPTMWGIFFEDINFGADGGLSAELVKNGSFEFPDPHKGWLRMSLPGSGDRSATVLDRNPLIAASPHYLRMEAGKGLFNEGFRGMGVREGEEYIFTALARVAGADSVSLIVQLMDGDGKPLAEARTGVKRLPDGIGSLRLLLKPSRTAMSALLKIQVDGEGTLDLDAITLVPEKTWKGRPYGLRADLVQMLADMKPGFMRFPGGCIVEGHELATRYQWKTTIGPVDERKLIVNRWNDEIKHRPTPDYYQSFHLGFFEYFQLCEEIGAAPLPVLNCGMACQFNTGELASLDALAPYLQDALDLIEFANGPASTPWGEKRTVLGHPEPFHLTMLGVGNEQWGPGYFERYERFAQAIKAKYPEIKLVVSAGPDPADERFKQAWDKFRALGADIIDEHCYAKPDWFFDAATRFDHYDRKGPKVFMGEYAAQSVATVSPENRNNLSCALAEAAFMTGLERNADVVVMSSYAPLLAHKDAWQWTPDLIWFDNLKVVGTPSYYVQKLFSTNRGDAVLPTRLEMSEAGTRLYATASREESTGTIILKVVNGTSDLVNVTLHLQGAEHLASEATALVMKGDNLSDENTFDDPRKVVPVETTIQGVGSEFHHAFPPLSLTVLRLKTARANP